VACELPDEPPLLLHADRAASIATAAVTQAVRSHGRRGPGRLPGEAAPERRAVAGGAT
jgi:hypothetical protein